MAWAKEAWTDRVGTNATKIVVAAAGTTTGTIDCNGANPLISLGLKTVGIFGTTPDGNIRIQLFGLDTDGANEVDTVPMWSAELPLVSTSEQRVTHQINVSALDHLMVKITNLDSTDNVSVWLSSMGAYQ